MLRFFLSFVPPRRRPLWLPARRAYSSERRRQETEKKNVNPLNPVKRRLDRINRINEIYLLPFWTKGRRIWSAFGVDISGLVPQTLRVYSTHRNICSHGMMSFSVSSGNWEKNLVYPVNPVRKVFDTIYSPRKSGQGMSNSVIDTCP